MRISAYKPESPQKTKPTTPAKPASVFSGPSPDMRYILHLQRTIGNQAVQRSLHGNTDGIEARLPGGGSTGAGYDVIRIPAGLSGHGIIRPKLKVGPVRDHYEQEADQVAARVVQPDSHAGPELRSHTTDSPIEPGSNLGKPLDADTNAEMSRKIGVDFSNVRVHTDDPAISLNKMFNARAFTHGSDIYFNECEYRPDSSAGRRLLAHELTHVVQQSRMTDKAAQRELIQRTTIGDILDEFFSPFSTETLWIMPETDNYTRIVRTWQPVIDAVNQAKADLAANCANWSATHMTDTSWTPGMTDPPVTDPHAHGIWVSSPPGTDPDTCRDAFIIYVTSKANPFSPTIQTFQLYTCSIGSFGIYVTVDSIDCAAKTARMKIWMYNAMDQGSFGRYASHPAFRLSKMERQYMWWSWTETHSWGPAGPPRVSPGGGSSRW